MTKIVAGIVSYLRPQQEPQPTKANDVLGPRPEGPASYYADGGDEPGRWMGRGATALGLADVVDEDDFSSVLAGRDPQTGERLISARGSATRKPKLGVGSYTRLDQDGLPIYGLTDAAAVLGVKESDVATMMTVGRLVAEGSRSLPTQPPGSYLVPVTVDGDRFVTQAELRRCDEARQVGITADEVAATGRATDELPLSEAARLAGVSVRYLRRLAHRYHENAKAIDEGVRNGQPSQLAYLRAHHGSRRQWLVTRKELADFLRRRRPPAVRVGYDLTLTTEKSLGVLALLSDRPTRTRVLAAIEAGNDWALRWMEQHSAAARVKDQVVPVRGWTVASFRHYTSRSLDPFPHHHNVVANTVEDKQGVRRALDARGLYRDATSASALATAEMRSRLTRDLGVTWRRTQRGTWEVDGIPDAVLREFSRRRAEIEDALRELEEAIGRGTTLDEVDQVVQVTRPPKSHKAADEMLGEWWARAGSLGFSQADLTKTTGRDIDPLLKFDPDTILAQLAAPDGICRHLSVFNRGDVLHALVDMTVRPTSDGSDGGTISEPATDADTDAEPAKKPEPRPLIVDAAGLEALADAFLASVWVEQLSPGTDTAPPRYTTREMLKVQDRVVARYRQGLHANGVAVPMTTVETVLAGYPALTAEQRELVRSFCSSGHRIQCAIGHPGAGKTTSMRAAREAWEAAGLRVVGAAVKGEAARTLATATGIPTETLAWYLTHDDPQGAGLDDRTVLVIDEASTVSDRDLDRIGSLAEQAGATLRLIGDPAQHGAVEAGGMFRVLCERDADHTPELTETHRLRNPHDRAAAEALRDNQILAAFEHLAAAGHLHVVENEFDGYVEVLKTWWTAHQAGQDHPMVDRRNRVRRALNRLAHGLRDANGELGRDHIVSHERRFATGDRIVARAPNRGLHVPDDRTAYVRNGAAGTIIAIARDLDGDVTVTVSFDGIGTIGLPQAFVDEHEIAGGRREVGIDHAYAVTSYAVTGSTLPVSTSRIDETSSRAETYVDITRGKTANHLYVTRAADPLDGERLPRLPADPLVDEVAGNLLKSIGERTAWEIRQAARDQAERQADTLGL